MRDQHGKNTSGSSGRFLRLVSSIALASLLAVSLVAIAPAVDAEALNGSDFNPGYIIDDTKFYDGNAMSQAQIQSFLEDKAPGTCGNSLCLKSLRYDMASRPASYSVSGNLRCSAYAGAAQEQASTIIFKVQQACGISAKVILVTLQKEQAIVTKLAPSKAALDRAMGYACPDTAPCAVTTLGFGNQVYSGARQFKTYKASNFGMQPGVHTIGWHPNSACGASTFAVQNYATAALYNYTPYRPNAAALANIGGLGDACSSYGNRNFWVFHNNWFGSPTGDPMGKVQTVVAGANSVTVTGWALDPDVPANALTVRVRGNGWTKLLTANGESADAKNAFAGAGSAHGFSATIAAAPGSQPICVDAINQGQGSSVTIGCSTVTISSSIVVADRISGTDRYNTALTISQKNFTEPVPTVYVASGEAFPDALSAVPVAAAQGVPVLLVPRAAVPATVLTELKRLQPKSIVLVGGTAALPAAIATELATVAPVTRVEGANRYGTSLAVGGLLGSLRSGRVYLVTGANFPDALSAASAAGHQDAPLVLIDPSRATVSAELAGALKSWGATSVTIVGGSAAISDRFADAVRGLPGVASVNRVAGGDRYSTSIAVNKSAFPTVAAGYLATGVTYADGLVGGAVAGRNGQPLYLAPTDCLPQGLLPQLQTAGTTSITLLGGQAALGSGVSALVPCS